MKSPGKTRKWIAGGALVLAGLGIGAAVATAGSASAASDAVTSRVTQATEKLDPTKSMRSDEELLTGTAADKVREAALAEFPDATIQRVETDSDGVYEAHILTADGQPLTVQVDKDFAVTGTDSHVGHRGPGGPGGPGGPAEPGDTAPPTEDSSGT